MDVYAIENTVTGRGHADRLVLRTAFRSQVEAVQYLKNRYLSLVCIDENHYQWLDPDNSGIVHDFAILKLKV